jgi:hypothetical protein
MNQQQTLVEFLERRFQEDEDAARTAGEDVGYSWVEHEQVIARGGKPQGSDYLIGIWVDHDAEAVHIARHDPERVLADVEALRQVLHLANSQTNGDSLEPVLQRLALPFASHPDYRSEWRP